MLPASASIPEYLVKSHLRATILLGVLGASIWLPAVAADTVVGINFVNPDRLSTDQLDSALDAMKAAGVRVIRTGIPPNLVNHGTDFVQRVYQHGMQVELDLGLVYPKDAPMREWRPKEYPDMWASHPLSAADPELFRAFFQPLLAKLESSGIKLAAIELGNEINWSAFNGEFPVPGSGKGVLLQDDLTRDPEGRQIAAGYLQYLKVLKVLKDVRDHSSLNAKTPIISAGLIDAEEGDIKRGAKYDSVSFSATLDYMRANGLDDLVDGYGVHIYPDPNPSTPEDRRMGAADRQSFSAECRPAGSRGGKPCWITEWGIPNKNTSCPSDEGSRPMVVRQVMDSFQRYASEGRLGGMFYFAWNTDAYAKSPDPFSVFRCGELTESGKLVISAR
jgi:hypothetical protein